MGHGLIKNGKQQVITPRDGKNWVGAIDKPAAKPQPPAIAEKQRPTGSYLWLGDLKL
jgi:hypothetical protein